MPKQQHSQGQNLKQKPGKTSMQTQSRRCIKTVPAVSKRCFGGGASHAVRSYITCGTFVHHMRYTRTSHVVRSYIDRCATARTVFSHHPNGILTPREAPSQRQEDAQGYRETWQDSMMLSTA